MKIYSVNELSLEKKNNNDQNKACLNRLRSLSSKAFDEKIHSIARLVIDQIDCTKCGNCCKSSFVGIQKNEVSRIAGCFDITTEEFIQYHMAVEPDGEGGYLKTKPCPMYIEHHCSIYEERPRSCKEYPGILNSQLKFRRHRILEEYGICPIVYHTIEMLKKDNRQLE